MTKINQRFGMRLLTKFGEKGVINLVKVVPLAGAIVGLGLDAASTKIIAKHAVKMFIDNPYNPNDDTEGDERIVIVDVDDEIPDAVEVPEDENTSEG